MNSYNTLGYWKFQNNIKIVQKFVQFQLNYFLYENIFYSCVDERIFITV